MDEAKFWLWLEGRLCHEFSGLPERCHRYLWCDGFTPVDYFLEDPDPRISGRCWICNGNHQVHRCSSEIRQLPRGDRLGVAASPE